MEKWLIKSADNNLADFGNTQKEKILYRIISNRGIESKEELEEFLNPSISKMHSPENMKDMLKASEIFLDAIDEHKKIRIIGDYDVDGIMSTYILYKFISKLNSTTDYKIPHRIKDGYGINKDIVEEAVKDKVDLIITCDNGISAFEPIEFAKENGLQVIVLDHHEPKIDENNQEILPIADAVVDPKRIDCPYPFKGLCGGAIAYKFVELVSSILGYEDGEVIRDYLEFACIATVCDVMDLVSENRIIVSNGLKLLNNTTNVGLKTLINETGLSDKTLEPYHLGFIIGPLFNASGRLDSADVGLRLLLEENIMKAKAIAEELKNLNVERTRLTKEGLDLYLRNIDSLKLYNQDVIVSYVEDVHESIAGIIAGRVKEKYNKPTIILTNTENGAKGSARSIDEFHITEAISKQGELLNSFGGHKLAAGLSLDIENIDEFRKNINENTNLFPEDFYKKVLIDLGLPISYLDIDFINMLDIIGPYGTKNPRPLFGAKDVYLGKLKLLGKNKNVLKMSIRENNKYFEGIMFQNLDKLEEDLEKMGKSLPNILVTGEEIQADIVYQGNINQWNGNKNLQITITNFRLKGGDENEF